MARRKVKIAFITNKSTRKATYNKRKECLKKKVSELSTLCGIDACVLICSLDDPQLEVWPNTTEVQRIIARFKQTPERERCKEMAALESFIRQKIKKVNEQLEIKLKKNHENKIAELMYHCLAGKIRVLNLGMHELNHLSQFIDWKLKDINTRTEAMKVISQQQVVIPATPPALQEPPMVSMVAEEILETSGKE